MIVKLATDSLVLEQDDEDNGGIAVWQLCWRLDRHPELDLLFAAHDEHSRGWCVTVNGLGKLRLSPDCSGWRSNDDHQRQRDRS